MSFVIDIVDECETAVPPASPTTPEGDLEFESDDGHLSYGLTSHFAISNGHGIYYSVARDTPANRAAYFDVSTRTLIPVGDL